MAGDYPDVVIGCVGGGSQLRRLRPSLPPRQDRGRHGDCGSSPSSRRPAPRMTRGAISLRLRRHGHDDAAGQDVHARAQTSCRRRSTPAACATTAWRRWSATLHEQGLIEAVAVPPERRSSTAALIFARTEGIIPAPETAHAIRAAIDEASGCKETGEAQGHRLQLQRPRPLRPGRLRRLPPRRAGGLRAIRGEDPASAGERAQYRHVGHLASKTRREVLALRGGTSYNGPSTRATVPERPGDGRDLGRGRRAWFLDGARPSLVPACRRGGL